MERMQSVINLDNSKAIANMSNKLIESNEIIKKKYADVLTDLFEARRLLARNRMGYSNEEFNSIHFRGHATKSKETHIQNTAALYSTAGRSPVKQLILSACGSSPHAMKALRWTVPRTRAIVTVMKLTIKYPGSVNRGEITAQVGNTLSRDFPEAFTLIQAARARLRGPRHPRSLTPYNFQPFAARQTSTLYVYDLLSDPLMSADFQNSLERMLEHAACHGPFKACVALNFYAGGGAENAALHYLNHYASRTGSSVLFILTDSGFRKMLPPLPNNVLVLDISDIRNAATPDQRQSILLNTLQACRPSLLHIINSETAWGLLNRMPLRFIPSMKIISSNFALQFADPHRKVIVGYAAANLPNCISKLDAVVTDNRRFATEGIEALGLTRFNDKLRVIYNPCSLDQTISRQDAEGRLHARLMDMAVSRRLKVIWAGRLDEEKRIDLLLDTAKLCEDFCEFSVYGSAVVSGETAVMESLKKQPNVILQGPFSSPLDWEADEIKHIFFFTSRWEGMPNTLVEAAYLGLPVCAMNVGGVNELIRDDTGWLLGEHDSAIKFKTTLKNMQANAMDVERRTRNLIQLVRNQHSRQSYVDEMDRLLDNLSIVRNAE